jgi:hypothetical protein
MQVQDNSLALEAFVGYDAPAMHPYLRPLLVVTGWYALAKAQHTLAMDGVG